MLSVAVSQAPANFAPADLVSRRRTVIQLEPVGRRGTQVRVRMLGYEAGEGYEAFRRFFERGNGYRLLKLRERVERGPTDWSSQGDY